LLVKDEKSRQSIGAKGEKEPPTKKTGGNLSMLAKGEKTQTAGAV